MEKKETELEEMKRIRIELEKQILELRKEVVQEKFNQLNLGEISLISTQLSIEELSGHARGLLSCKEIKNYLSNRRDEKKRMGYIG